MFKRERCRTDQFPNLFAGPHALEIELLLCACRVRIDPPAAKRIRDILETEIDWNWLVQTSLNHRVAALLFRGLLEEAAGGVPPDIAAGAAGFIESQLGFNRRQADELVRVIAAMAESGIATLAFKGPVLSEVVYGDVGLRNFEDLDFLLRAADIPVCLRVLRELGYDVAPHYDIAVSRYYGQDLFYKADCAVEPHWTLVPPFLGIPTDLDGIWDRAVRMRFRGSPVLTLSPEDSLELLCIHGTKHEWSRLQWICDVAETVRTSAGMDWTRLLSRLRRRGCLRMALLGLTLAHDLLGAGIPEAVRALAERDLAVVKLQRRAASNVFAEGRSVKGGDRITQFNLSVRERNRDRARFVAATIFLPRRVHFQLVPLPGRLLLLAFPIKLLHDYWMVPVWAVLKRIAGSAAPRANPVLRFAVNGWKFGTCWMRYMMLGSGSRVSGIVDFVLENPVFNAAQLRDELEALARILQAQQPESALEIGTFRGGTLLLLCRLAHPRATIVSVDLPGGGFGGGYSHRRARLYRLFARRGQRLQLIQGDSHSAWVLEQVKSALGGRQLDYVFLDGDHTYAGVKSDFDNCARMVRKGGIIVFHDIVEGTPEMVGGVPRFWNEIKARYRHTEIIKDSRQAGWGIGVLHVD